MAILSLVTVVLFGSGLSYSAFDFLTQILIGEICARLACPSLLVLTLNWKVFLIFPLCLMLCLLMAVEVRITRIGFSRLRWGPGWDRIWGGSVQT